MCAPAIPIAALAITAASAAASARQQYVAGRSAAKVAKNNRLIAEQAAVDARKVGGYNEYVYRQRVAQLVGRQRALVGASGAEVDTGSTADFVADTLAIGELDALMIRSNAERSAWGYQTQAQEFGLEAQAAKLAATWGAGATLLGGAAAVVGGASNLRSVSKTPVTYPGGYSGSFSSGYFGGYSGTY